METLDLAAVEARCAPLLEAAAAQDFHLAGWWWRSMQAACLPENTTARFLLHSENGAPVCLLPILANHHAETLTGPYTCRYQPLFAPNTPEAAITRAARAFAPALRQGVFRLDALDPEAPWLPPFLAGLRAAGLVPLRFEHFGNWHEPIAGRSWATYLAARGGALRETVRRKLKRSGDTIFRIVTGGEDLEPAIAGYEDVYARSWKVPEPFPRFNATMMREAAAAGTLRLGLLASGETVIAAQIWIVANGAAMVTKLGHDEAFKPLSPGTVLTARMIQHFIDTEAVRELDFGRGDDPYKQLWTTQRRPRIGYLLANPWRPAGALALARHVAGRLRHALSR